MSITKSHTFIIHHRFWNFRNTYLVQKRIIQTAKAIIFQLFSLSSTFFGCYLFLLSEVPCKSFLCNWHVVRSLENSVSDKSWENRFIFCFVWISLTANILYQWTWMIYNFILLHFLCGLWRDGFIFFINGQNEQKKNSVDTLIMFEKCLCSCARDHTE